MLVYSETVLIAQYTFETTARCLCLAPLPPPPPARPGLASPASGGSWSAAGGGWLAADGGGGDGGACVGWLPANAASRRVIELLGLHASAPAALPLFLCYLGTLMLTYRLGALAAGTEAAGAEQRLQVCVHGGGAEEGEQQQPARGGRPPGGRARQHGSGSFPAAAAGVVGWGGAAARWLVAAAVQLGEHVR
jgi:hypothetical protein